MDDMSPSEIGAFYVRKVRAYILGEKRKRVGCVFWTAVEEWSRLLR